MNTNKMKEIFNLFKLPIISIIITIYGLYIIKLYNIDLKQEIILSVDGFKNVISVVTGSNAFFGVLKDNIVFEKIAYIYATEEYEWLIYEILILDVTTFVSWNFPSFKNSNIYKIPYIIKFSIDLIVNFFITFVLNHIIVLFFCNFPTQIYSSYLEYLNDYSQYLYSIKIPLVGVLINATRMFLIIWFICTFMIFPIFEALIELFIFFLLSFCLKICILPLWQTILITALIRSVFRIAKYIKEDYF